MKILVLGHGRHGKDTVSELLSKSYGFTFSSSSYFCAERFIFDEIKDEMGYGDINQCYNDRHNHRQLWRELIEGYNENDPSRLAREMLEVYDTYCGMRSNREYQASKDLFDIILWVDASSRIDYVDPTLDIEFNPYEMTLVDNNGDMHDLVSSLDSAMREVL